MFAVCPSSFRYDSMLDDDKRPTEIQAREVCEYVGGCSPPDDRLVRFARDDQGALLVVDLVRVLNPDWDARVVDDGDIISCGGVTSGIDEAPYLVQAFWPGDPQLESDVRDFVDFHYRSPVATLPEGRR